MPAWRAIATPGIRFWPQFGFAVLSKVKKESCEMDQFAILAVMRPKPGKENALEDFLTSARSLVLDEPGRRVGTQ
jgi:hypothetical protein